MQQEGIKDRNDADGPCRADAEATRQVIGEGGDGEDARQMQHGDRRRTDRLETAHRRQKKRIEGWPVSRRTTFARGKSASQGMGGGDVVGELDIGVDVLAKVIALEHDCRPPQQSHAEPDAVKDARGGG